MSKADQVARVDPLRNETEAAAKLGVKCGTLQVWRSTNRYPLPYVKVGRLVRYRDSALDKFIADRTVHTVDSQ